MRWVGPADAEFPASRTEVRAPEGGAPPEESGSGILPPLAVFVAMIALVAAIRALRTASGDG
ncbi:MAG TPA: hypothetical protein VLA33_08455 [Gemmatimonadota bacterium]|nr:hypothetical protein [Gemmatimonadota bacterium]